jgi:hypothetical protein
MDRADLSYRTAIARKKLSAPAQFLKDNGKLVGRCLDFGSGRGFDAEQLGVEQYDPHWHPVEPYGFYDTIMCNYVLNVIDTMLEPVTIDKVRHLLAWGGKAYFTVRRDVKKEGYTSRGTFQRNVVLDFPVVCENKSFCIYEVI